MIQMAITNSNDSSHIVRTSAQWKSSYDSYDTIPLGVLCVELIPDGSMKIKIGDGHNTFAKLPYVGGQAVSDYYSKRETDERIKAILKEESAMCIRGVLSGEAALPSNPAVGDVYFVLSRSSSSYIEYVYATNHSWIPIGGTPVDSDLSGYATQDYVNEQIDEVNTRIDEIVKGGTSSHLHDNKDILDSTTASFTKEDKAKLDSMSSFTSADRDKLNVLIKNSTSFEKIAALEKLAHEHSNKRILDRTTASFTTDYEQKMKWIRPYTGAENGYEGIMGLVPPAQPGEEEYVLNGAGEWVPMEGGSGSVELTPATTSKLGGIIVGKGLKVDQFGILSTEENENNCDCDNVGHFDRTSGAPKTGEIFNSYSGQNMNKATGDYSHAEGIRTTASGEGSHSEGETTTASGGDSHAEGYNTTASGNRSHTEGMSTKATSDEAHAEGIGTTASGNYSHAEGSYTNATKDSAHSEGYGGRKITDVFPNFSSSTSKDEIVAAWGTSMTDGFTLANGMGSHAEGFHTLALDASAHAEGDATHALGKGSHSEGHVTKAVADDSHAEGDQTVTKGQASHAEGFKSTTLGQYAHAEGCNTTADGYNHSEGVGSYTLLESLPSYNVWITPPETIIEAWNVKNFTLAKGNGSHAEGQDTLAIGQASHAEGFKTRATALSAHSEGRNTKADGYYSHAEGMSSVASGDYSHAQGNYTIANGGSQFTLGKFNIPDNDEKYAVIIGGGTADNDRKNIFTVDWSGNIELGVSDADGNITYGTINGVDITNITVNGVTDINESEENNTITVVFSDGTSKDIAIKCDGGFSETPIATTETPGVVKPGTGLEILEDGTLNVIVDTNNSNVSGYEAGNAIEFIKNAKKDDLPEEYEKLKCLRVTDGFSQYIDTGYFPTLNTKIIAKFKASGKTSNTSLFGTRTDATHNNYVCWVDEDELTNTYRIALIYGSNAWVADIQRPLALTPFPAGQDIKLEISAPDGAIINNTRYYYQEPEGTPPDTSIYLFSVNKANAPEINKSYIGILYYLQIYNDAGSLVREYVPVYNKNTSEVGLYDRVNKTFHTSNGIPFEYNSEDVVTHYDLDITNQSINVKYDPTTLAVNENNELTVIGGGSGASKEYTAGDGINIYDEKDSDYDEISYIEATGSQYTLLNYQPTATTRIVTDFAMSSGNPDNVLWGVRTGNTSGYDQFVLWMYGENSKPMTGFVYGSNTWGSADSSGGRVLNYEETTRLVADASENGLFINDELIHSITKVHHGFNSIGKLCIFGVNRINSIEREFLIKAKIYSMQIYEGSTLIINLVPRVRNSDNVPGFYDTINEVFYPSATIDYFYDSSSRTSAVEVKHIIAAKNATKDSLGSIIVGAGLDISPDGVLSVINDNTGVLDVKPSEEKNQIIITTKEGDKPVDITIDIPEIPIATQDEPGIVKPVGGLTIDEDGTIDIKYDPKTLAINENNELTVISGGSGSSGSSGSQIGITGKEGIQTTLKPADDNIEGYHQVLYLRNNADAYIATDYIPQPNTRVVVDFSVNPGYLNGDQAIFGSRNGSSSGSRQFVFWAKMASGYTELQGGFVYGGNYSGSKDYPNGGRKFGTQPGERFIIDASANGTFINGEWLNDITKTGTPSPYPICYFACGTNADGSTTAYKAGSYTLYGSQIYEDDELVRDFIPVINSQGMPGLYDKITETFYPPKNGYTFTYDDSFISLDGLNYDIELLPATPATLGGVKPGEGLKVDKDGVLSIRERIATGVDLDFVADTGLRIADTSDMGIVIPEDYSLISYIENINNTYTQLDYYPSSNTRIVARVSFRQGVLASDSPIFGTHTSDTRTEYGVRAQWTTKDTWPLIKFINGNENVNDIEFYAIKDYQDNQVITIETRPTDGLYIDGLKVQDCNGGEFDKSVTMNIGRINGSNTTGAKMRIYKVEIYDDNHLSLNLIPVLNSSGRPGLYDTIRRKFFDSTTTTLYSYDETSVDTVNVEKKISLLPATKTTIGGVIVGDGLHIDDNGVLTATGGGTGGGTGGNVGVKSETGLSVSIDPNRGVLGDDLIKLSYIRNNADAYIATNYIPNANTRVVVDYCVNPGFVRQDQALFGSRYSSSSNQFVCWVGKTNSTEDMHIQFVYAGNVASDVPPVYLPIKPGIRTIIDVSKENVYVNGEFCHGVRVTGSLPTYPLGIFACITSDDGKSTAYAPGSYTVYHVQIYEENELVRDYIPAYHKTRGPGLYDMITGVFHGSANSYSFAYDSSYIGTDGVLYNVDLLPATPTSLGGVIPGNGLSIDANGVINVSERIITGVDINFTADTGLQIHDTSEYGFVIPENYALISYIENPSNAYAALDYYVSSNTRIVARASFKKGVLDGNGVVFGSRNGGTDKEYVLWVQWQSSTYPLLRFANGSQGWSSINGNAGIPIDGYKEYQIVTLETLPTDGLYVDGVKVQECTGGTFTPGSYTMHIGHLSGAYYAAEPMRIHSVQIFEGESLKFNLVPVLNPDGIAGLYDTVRSKFFGSNNSTKYIYDADSANTMDVEKKISLLPATATTIGGIKVGNGLTISPDGVLSVMNVVPPVSPDIPTTPSQPPQSYGVMDVSVTANEVGKLDILKDGETTTIDIFDNLESLILNCTRDS